MRTFVTNPQRDQTGLREHYRQRTSKEWDISFNMPIDFLTMPDTLIATINVYIQDNPGVVSYALIGGIEVGTNDRSTTTKDEHHVHCALVITKEMTKEHALRVFQLPEVHDHNKHKRYAVPRDNKWSYVGWRLHHTKTDTKIDQSRSVLYEYGTLPTDLDTPDIKKQVYLANRKWNNEFVAPIKKVKQLKIKAVKTSSTKVPWVYNRTVRTVNLSGPINTRRRFFTNKNRR